LQNCDSKLIALIETPTGLENAKEIARCQRVDALMFGGADMSAELRCQFAYEPLLFVRSQLVIAAASAGINLIDVPFINLKDNLGLIEETQKVQALGFTGKAAIHPNQVHTIHQAFAPTKAQVEYAQAVVDAVDSPDAGVVVVNGRMIDRPIILASEKVLQLAALSKGS
jgi:citrate lyase beta subunit